MAIKKLQNDFTTPEQSKRLLELGVPADSANMHYHQECVRIKYGKEEFEYFIRYGKPDTNKYSTDIPCWSVGRLIEIIMRCHKYGILFFSSIRIYKTDILNNALIDYLMKYMPDMDFSKLEE